MKTRTHNLLFLLLSALPSQADLVAHWSLEEGTGSVAADSTANNNIGTIAGSTLWNTTNLPPVPSGTSAALQMDGIDGQIDIVGYKGITGTGDRTIAAWIKTEINSTAQDKAIASWGTNASTRKWTFRIQTGNGTPGAIRIEANGGYMVGNAIVTDAQWHHVAVTWANDGSPDILDAKLYVDGVLDAEFGSFDAPPSASQSIAINTAVGADVRIGDDFQLTHNWEGGMDDVRIYDEALDADAISALAVDNPILTSFEASAEVIASGSSVNLSWISGPSNDSLSIDNGVGDVLGLGMISVTPTTNTTYTLTGTRGVSINERQVTVLVDSAPLIEGLINLGSAILLEGQSTTIRWAVLGETNLSINGTDVSGLDEIVLSPTETTTYTFSATNAFGTTNSEFIITVLDVDSPDLGWTATGLPDGPLSQWDPAINATGNEGITFTNTTGGEVQSGLSNFTSVSTWVNSPGYNLSSNPLDSWQDGFGDIVTKQDVSWEMVLRPGDFSGTHVLFNTGGNGDGTAIVLTDSTLDFRVQTADTDAERLIISADLSALGSATDFFHIVATADVDAGTPGTATLYVNGELVASASSTSPIDDWDGGDLAELGKGANIPTSTTFPFDPFTGDIALFNYYGARILDDSQVASKYEAISGQGGGLTITAITYDGAASEIRLTFTSVPGRSYALDSTTDLSAAEWSEIRDSILADDIETTVIHSGITLPDPENLRRFYRIRPEVN